MKTITSIKLSESDWATLHDRLKRDYQPSVLLIREKMRRVLGFVPREHKEWNYQDQLDTSIHVNWKVSFPEIIIYLDFYDDRKKTMFVMKYSEYLDKAS